MEDEGSSRKGRKGCVVGCGKGRGGWERKIREALDLEERE